MQPILAVEDLVVRRGGVAAVDRVSIVVPPGTIVGLIGPNGAGKTSLVDAVTGFVAAEGGRVLLRGVDISGLPPHRRARAGLGRTFQSGELFDELTVGDNVGVALDPRGLRGRIRAAAHCNRSTRVNQIRSTLALLDLSHLDDRAPAQLSNGQRTLVGVARALAGGADLVLLDEPAAGLDTAESRELGERLRRVRQAGITVVLVDHDMSLVLEVCDWVFVLDFGHLIASGRPRDITRDPAVLASYLGDTVATRIPDAHAATGAAR